MAKFAPNEFYSNGLSYVAGANRLHACSSQPNNFADVSGVSLGSVAVGSSDFTEGPGSPSGRKLEVAAKSITGSASGTANHLALVNNSNNTLRYVTTCTSVAMSNGATQDFGAWSITIEAPN